MISFIKPYFMPAMVLLIIFWGEIGSCTQIITGSLNESINSHVWAFVLAGITYTMLLMDMINGTVSKRNRQVLIFIVIVLGLYFITHFFYNEARPKYWSYLLLFISESIPAAYLGMKSVQHRNFNKINNLLPLFIIPAALLIGTIGVRYAAMGERVNNDDSGLNYQTVSYYMAFSYSYAAYHVFLNQHVKGKYNGIMRLVMLMIMLYCGMVCLVSGGRGAFVYIIFVSIFLAYSYFKNSKRRRIRTIFILVLLAAIVLWLVNRFNVMESAGMMRVMDKLMYDEERFILYNKAYTAFLDSPILGNGLGSVWWTVGFYSHNMILDLLSEVGIIGTTIFLVILAWTIRKVYISSKYDNFFLLLLIVMIGALVRAQFSGYWVSAIKLFFICSMMYCLPNYKYRK